MCVRWTPTIPAMTRTSMTLVEAVFRKAFSTAYWSKLEDTNENAMSLRMFCAHVHVDWVMWTLWYFQ